MTLQQLIQRLNEHANAINDAHDETRDRRKQRHMNTSSMTFANVLTNERVIMIERNASN
jgi:hypothetical protein